ncbi:MAG: HAD-IA family hydrolase [Candidatus Bathyarchaeia archaeon]
MTTKVSMQGKSSPQINTLIFDVSGVLLNDLYTVWKADSDAYESCGIRKISSIKIFKESFKMPIIEYHRSMGVPDKVIPELEAAYRQSYQKYSKFIKIFPDVKRTLRKLQQNDVTLSIASNIPSDFLMEHLKSFGIINYFNAITGQDDCEEQKPSPQPILVTLRKLDAKPMSSAYVGDMEEDIIAGKRAGVFTIGICRKEGYHPCWKLKRQNPDFLIKSLSQLFEIL